jgi:hypothetical protein
LKVIELHRKGKPFAVIISKEITGTTYSLIYQDRFIRCYSLKKWEIRWFSDNKYLFKKVCSLDCGEVYEYRKFKRKMTQALKHNFLVRNQIITGGYI